MRKPKSVGVGWLANSSAPRSRSRRYNEQTRQFSGSRSSSQINPGERSNSPMDSQRRCVRWRNRLRRSDRDGGGDHLHPQDDGYKAMADSIDLKMLMARPCLQLAGGTATLAWQPALGRRMPIKVARKAAAERLAQNLQWRQVATKKAVPTNMALIPPTIAVQLPPVRSLRSA